MIDSVTMQIISINILILFMNIMLNIVYFSKPRIKKIEHSVFSKMLICSLLGSIFGLTFGIVTTISHTVNVYAILLEKTYTILIIDWILILSFYTYIISNKKDISENKFIDILKCFLLISILLYLVPITLGLDGNKIVVGGMLIYITYALSSILMLFNLVMIFRNIKHIKEKKYVPIYSMIILTALFVFIQTISADFNYLNSLLGMVIGYLMYFTIENPDMKLLEETLKSKEISDNANEEKTLFLYNMTQEIKEVTNKIDDDADIILDSKDYDEIYDSARDIKARTSVFVSATNDILNMSSVDANTIKVYNEKYNIKTILKQIVSIYGDLCNNKDLKFRTNIDHDVPELLYGDGIGLKEVLTTILNNSVKYTNKGFVELSVNTIIKGDICRLIITIEDSGSGIKSEDINEIKVSNTSLAKVNKLLTLMNGTMLVSSEYGIGTKIKIILDQKIEIIEDTEAKKYEEALENIKILTVDDSEAGLKIIEKLLKGSKAELTKATNGKECIDKIKTNKFDLILLDEELSQITANELIIKIKEIRNFETPIVLLTKNNNYEYNEEYIKNGFAGYILKPLKKDTFVNKINKYVKKK